MKYIKGLGAFSYTRDIKAVNPILKYASSDTFIHYLTIQSFQSILSEKLPMVIDCYSDWCPACSEMKPAFEKLALEYGNKCVFAKVRTDEDLELAYGFQIDSIPTFLFFAQGAFLGKLVGAIGYLNLKQSIDKLLQIDQQIARGELKLSS